MKWVRTAIGAVIAISVIPVIILTVINVTELKDVKNVQFELLSEEDDIFFITSGTYNKLILNKNIINYDIESNYPLITQEEMDRTTWKINDDLKNEIYIDENGQKRIIERVGQITFDGSENWIIENYEGRIFFYVTNNYIPNRIELINSTNLKAIMNNNLLPYYSGKISTLPMFWTTTGAGYFEIYIENINTLEQLEQYLSQNPLTVTYELAVKNPKSKIIEPGDVTNDGDNYYISYPLDYKTGGSAMINGVILIDDGTRLVYPMTDNNNNPVGKTLIYELTQPRTVEVYDFSTFKLTYDNNRIRILFDIDEGYYLWEITNDDRLIPINGQYDLGNIWTVKFYVYEIQQPLIRSLVLLIPLIVVSGLLFYLFKLVNERR